MFVSQDPDFAEVLTDLNSRELFWLSRGQLEISVVTEGRDPRRISGFIIGRKSCDSKCPPSCSSRVLVIPSGCDTTEASNSGVTENVFSLLELVCAHPPVAVFVLLPMANLAYRPSVGFGGARLFLFL